MKLEDKGLRNVLDIDETSKLNVNPVILFDGDDNTFTIGKNCSIEGVHFYFKGNGHTLILKDRVGLHGGAIIFENDGNLCQIGSGTNIYAGFQIAISEPKRKVIIGNNCLFSWSVRMRTTDSHSIWDLTTKERINRGKDIIIDDRVWLGEALQILKGAHIQSDSVVGTGAVVTGKTFPPNSIIAGNPAKVIKSNIYWKVAREDI